ncbi:MAG: hypothetical protein M3253_08255, partial [Chloroflexota bacterium]|nr:hypothetical protein [Chloroflexota bacterium]
MAGDMNEQRDPDRSLQQAGERWRASLPAMPDPYPAFHRAAAGPPPRASLLGAALASVLVALVGAGMLLAFLTKPTDLRVGLSSPSPTTATSVAPEESPVASASPTQPPSMEPADGPSPSAPPATAEPTDDYEAQLYRQAERALDRWADVVADAPPNAIVFVHGLTDGGGWRGRGAGNRKSAFMSGRVVATVPLPTDVPPPGDVVWPDGATTTVPLISAAVALDELVREMSAGSCPECRPLEVVGAKLVVGEAATSRGRVTAPLWQFEFVPADEPLMPITHVAVRDRISIDLAAWESEAPNALGDRIEAAYGSPADDELTVLFVGALYRGDRWCGADYTAEAVESELAVVVIVRGHSRPPPDSTPPPCLAVGAGRTAVATLNSPLGDRTVLEVVLGTPVELRSGAPPPDGVRDY